MQSYPQPGSAFGRYDVLRQLGRGGMGVVYAARQRDLDREVALKLLAPELADDDAYRRRFLREARILARIDSPHVVGVHDAGEHDGLLYLATRLVPDGDLESSLRERGPMPTDLALDLAAQVARGLQAAHEAGVLHRDVKPSNVLVEHRSDGSLRAVVCDFGVAADEHADHTRTDSLVGTFGYLAPERHEGRPATVAADLYALGCVLWAMLTGSAPYDGGHGQQVLAHVSAPVRRLGPQHPAARLDPLLAALMAKDPAARPRDAASVVARIAALRSGDAPLPPTVRPRRGALVATLSAVLAVVAVVVALVVTAGDGAPDEAGDPPVEPASDSAGDSAGAATGSEAPGSEAPGSVPRDDYGVVVGPDDAPHEVVVYSDLACPPCAELDAVSDEVVALAEAGEIRLVRRPVAILANSAAFSSESANAVFVVRGLAGDDLAARFLRELLLDQPDESARSQTSDWFAQRALRVGLPEDQLDQVRAGVAVGQYAALVQQATDQALADGVVGVPHVVVDGTAVPAGSADEMLDSVLAEVS